MAIASTTTVTRGELEDFIRPRHKALLSTTRADGRPQLSPVSCGLDTAGRIVISTYPQRAKARNIRKDPRPRSSTCPRRWSRSWSTSG